MPLPSDLELPTPKNKEWELIPEDNYQCEITDIEYKIEKNNFKKKETDPDEVQKMNFEFTIIEEGKFYGRKMWKKMSVAKPLPPRGNNNKSWIFRIASALAGHPLTFEEGENYTTSDVNGFIHKQIRVNVVHEVSQKDGNTYANIDSFLMVKQQLPPFDPNKVKDDEPVEDEPEAPQQPPAPKQPQSGLEKARAVANSLPAAKTATAGQIEGNSAPSESEIDVSNIPF